jgi:hypothetical protein
MSQIRITKTDELEEILKSLKSQWPLMDEVEIVKMAISYFFRNQSQNQKIELLSEHESQGIYTSLDQIKQGRSSKYDSQNFLEEVMSD